METDGNQTKGFLPKDGITKAQEEERAYLENLGKTIPGELLTKKARTIPEYNAYGPGREVIREATEKVNEIYNKRVLDIEAKYNGLLARMRELQDEKDRLLDGPLTKEELLGIARKELPQKQGEFKKSFLEQHFANCQIKKASPLSELDFRLQMNEDADIMLFYLLITDEDIEAAISLLPDIGISEKARKSKARKIEKEISELSLEIDLEMKNLKILDAPIDPT